MITDETQNSNENVCGLRYLIEMTGGNKQLIKDIIDAFLKQVPDELKSINDAVTNAEYATIKSFAHTMKSTVSIMGVSMLAPILQEMEELGARAENLEKIKELNKNLNFICRKAVAEIEIEKLNYA